MTSTSTHSPAGALIAITMGDPCGIGPEVVARVLASGRSGPCVVVGDVSVMRRALRQDGIEIPVLVLHSPQEALQAPPRCLPVWAPPELAPGLADLPMGRVEARAGRAAAECITAAAQLALHGAAAAVVTAPIHKQALAAAGVSYPGHTEMLQALAARPDGSPPPVRMMLANTELRVVLVTIHVSLRDAIMQVTFERVLETLRVAHRYAGAGLARPPRIAVAGLNPHAGEGGLFGSEEQRVIAPAIAAACTEGIAAVGPFAPDTVFMRARNTPEHAGEFDVVVAMTHDHGLIPIKYLGVDAGVNVTLGLPFVRTSPDHGTAFDIAGTGSADPRSLAAAIAMARTLAS